MARPVYSTATKIAIANRVINGEAISHVHSTTGAARSAVNRWVKMVRDGTLTLDSPQRKRRYTKRRPAQPKPGQEIVVVHQPSPSHLVTDERMTARVRELEAEVALLRATLAHYLTR